MKFKRQPWKHQLEAIEKASALNHYALFFEMGCLASHTQIKINKGGASKVVTIEELYRKFNGVELSNRESGWMKGIKVRSYTGERIALHGISAVVRSGVKECLRISVKRKPSLVCTPEHKILTKQGWKKAGDLLVGDMVAVDSLVRYQKKEALKKIKKPRYNLLQVGEFYPYGHLVTQYKKKVRRAEKHRLLYEASINKLDLDTYIGETYKKDNTLKYIDPNKFHIHHKDHNPRNNILSNLECLTKEEHLKHHGSYKHFGHGEMSYSMVESIEVAGEQMTYDICCEDPHHNFVANGIVVHNSGKSLTAVNILRWKYAVNERLLRTLIIGPPIVLENWVNEIKLNSNISEKDITVLYGPGKERIELLLEKGFNEDGAKGHIFITNYEALTVMPDLYDLLIKWNPEAIVWDEGHKLKSMQSARTKKAIKISDLARYRYLLTGTPVLNSPMDLFAQFRVLDKGETFGTNFFVFRAKYFYDKNAGMPKSKYFPDWRIKPDSLDLINARIKRVSARVKKEDCLDLPPLVKKTILVEMGKEQRTHYNLMKKAFITYLNDKACVAELALTKGLRLQQIASGYLKLDDGSEVEIKDNPRQEALRDLLEELTPTHKVLVWACFKQNYAQIRKVCDELKIKYVEVHGDVAGSSRFESVRSFNEDQDVRVFIGHPGSGGIGINLVAASYSIFYSRSFSLEHDLQAESRNHRGGSGIHEKITRIDLVAKDSIDSLIAERLALKESISERVLRDVATRI